MKADPVSVVTRLAPESALGILDVSQVLERVESRGRIGWVIEGYWPADAYGVLGAEDKAGKTFALLDLGLSVASGTSWLGHFAVAKGSVLAFLGEGDERATMRRLLAIGADRGVHLADLEGSLRLAFAVPRLSDLEHLAAVERELSEHPARLVIVDPLYLAAAGAKGSDLYAMGELLGGLQRLAQDAGAALVVSTHWNKTGEGSGARRFTGVGPGAWGRVLASAAVERRTTEPDGTSDVTLRFEFSGSEIADQTFRVRRRVRAEDPTDLDSPLHYAVDVTLSTPDRDADMPPSRSRVLAALGSSDSPLSVREIGDRLAVDGTGPPLKRTTIQEALEELAEIGLTDAERPGSGLPNRWWRR